MRVLIAGRNADVLATIAGTFASDLKIQAVSSRTDALALLEGTEFDLVVACETLTDGSGLEVLSHVVTTCPNCLRIFAARPSTLKVLQGELGLFSLFRTLPYPINMKRLSAAVKLARECMDDEQPRSGKIRHVVLDEERPATPKAQQVARERASAAPPAARVALPAGRAAARPKASMPAPAVARGVASAPTAPATLRTPVAAAPTAPVALRTPVAATPPAPQARGSQPTRAPSPHDVPTIRIPESDSFKRAVARRNAAKLEGDMPAAFDPPPARKRGQRTQRAAPSERREPSVGSESLAELARLSAVKRTPYVPRNLNNSGGTSKRRALFVGTGVFAAAAVGLLTFMILSPDNSIARSPAPVQAAASIARVLPDKVFPWQTAAHPAHSIASARQMTAAAVEPPTDGYVPPDEEQSHPPPPPPLPPPPPAEPPSSDDDD